MTYLWSDYQPGLSRSTQAGIHPTFVTLIIGKVCIIADHIKPACLPPRGYDEAELGDTSLYAVGWGKTNNLANISPVLNQLDVKLISNSEVR